MKKWEMPQVKIDQFVANEYIASACGKITPISSAHDFWYIDLSKDFKYQRGKNYNEMLGKGTNYSIDSAVRSYYSQLPWATQINNQELSYWLNDVDVYYRDDQGIGGGVTPGEGASYTDIDTWGFHHYGTYDVYVARTGAVALYPKNTDSSFDPTISFNKS